MKIDRYTLAAVILGALGLGWRLILTAVTAPPTNSDEAIMGLVSLHIAQGRELPTYFYGQHYMGTIEAYAAAPFVKLLGPTVTALRIPSLLFYVAFLVLMFLLVRRIYSPGLAVLVTGLFALGSDRIVKNQLMAIGGYPETPPMVAGLFLVTCALITRRWDRWWAYGGWGLTFGLVTWNHWLPAPYLAGALVLLIAARVGDRRAWLTVGAGFVLGALPLLVDNVRAWPRHSLAEFIGLNIGIGDATVAARLVGGAWLGLPLGMGLCPPNECAGWNLWWGPVVVILLLAAVALSARPTFRRGANPRWAVEAIRFTLATAGLVSLLSYVRSPSAGLTAVESSRYLSVLALSLPGALWPLWRLISRADPVGAPWARTVRALAAVPVAALAAAMLAATVLAAAHLPAYREEVVAQRTLLAGLENARLTYVHTPYWTCYWLIYFSEERITCGVLGDDGERGHNRLSRYWHDDPQAVVAPIGSPLDGILSRKHPAPWVIGRYHVYPATTTGT